MSSPGYATGQNWGSLKSEWLSTMDMAWYDKNIQTPVVLSCKFLHTNTSGSKSDTCIQLITIVYNCHQTLFDLQPGMMIPAQLTVFIFQGLKPRSGPQISRQVQSFVHVLRALPQAKAQLRAGWPSKCIQVHGQPEPQVMPEVLKQDVFFGTRKWMYRILKMGRHHEKMSLKCHTETRRDTETHDPLDTHGLGCTMYCPWWFQPQLTSVCHRELCLLAAPLIHSMGYSETTTINYPYCRRWWRRSRRSRRSFMVHRSHLDQLNMDLNWWWFHDYFWLFLTIFDGIYNQWSVNRGIKYNFDLTSQRHIRWEVAIFKGRLVAKRFQFGVLL